MLNILVLTGGLEDAPATAALTKSLRNLDHRVTTLSPLFAGIDPNARSLARRLVKLNPEVDGQTYACELYTGRNVHGVEQVFIGHPQLFATVRSLSEGDDAALRLEVFARAAAAFVANDITNAPDVVHALDVAGARSLALLAVTDHEAGYALSGNASVLVENLDMASAFIAADEETAAFVRGALEARRADEREGKSVHRITPGVESGVWNPLTDSHLAHRFDPVDRTGKALSKAALQRELALPVRADVPLFGAVATPADEAGLRAFLEAAPEFLRNDVQVAIQVDASGELVAALEDLWDRFPDRLQIRTGADANTRHAIVGSCDVYISLSDEGALSREAQRYGSVPLTHRSAALADDLVDCDAELVTGTAFLADSLGPEALLGTARRAVAAFTRSDEFGVLMRRCMEQDHSWTRTAHSFVRAYKATLPPAEEVAA